MYNEDYFYWLCLFLNLFLSHHCALKLHCCLVCIWRSSDWPSYTQVAGQSRGRITLSCPTLALFMSTFSKDITFYINLFHLHTTRALLYKLGGFFNVQAKTDWPFGQTECLDCHLFLLGVFHELSMK